jgi:superfamily II DNA or RNA helicase
MEMGINTNISRNAEALLAVNRHTESTLVLCGVVAHVQAFAMSCGGIPCWSGMSAKARRHAIEGFKAREFRILVASTLADEGFDAPCAEVLVLLSGGRNEARTIQRTGRVLRPHPGKTEAVIYDFKDTFHPLMHRHAQKRAAIYEKLGYAGDYSWA